MFVQLVDLFNLNNKNWLMKKDYLFLVNKFDLMFIYY